MITKYEIYLYKLSTLIRSRVVRNMGLTPHCEYSLLVSESREEGERIEGARGREGEKEGGRKVGGREGKGGGAVERKEGVH